MVSSGSRPNFTGVWKLNSEKSTMRGAVPKQILVKIEHREPTLIQQILFTDANGTEQRQTFTCQIGSETPNSIGGATLWSCARWQGMELVIESRMRTPDRESYFKDHWSLSDDGRTLTMAHRDDDLAGQVSVLEKSSEADATRFGAR
jgi:hypothetical protein